MVRNAIIVHIIINGVREPVTIGVKSKAPNSIGVKVIWDPIIVIVSVENIRDPVLKPIERWEGNFALNSA